MRAALAAVALGLSFLLPVDNPTAFRTLVAVFFVYTLLLAWRMRALSGMKGLLALAADTAFFFWSWRVLAPSACSGWRRCSFFIS